MFPAAKGIVMESLAAGLIVMVNGFVTVFALMLNWYVLFGVVSIVSLGWLSRLEVHDLDRTGTKPSVMKH